MRAQREAAARGEGGDGKKSSADRNKSLGLNAAAVKRFGALTTEPLWGPVRSNKHPVFKVNAPETWLTLERALKQAPNDGYIGLLFTAANGLSLGGVDLDRCRNPKTGKVVKWAREIVADFNSYTEVSVSGAGLHIYARGAPRTLSPNSLEMEGKPINGKQPYLEAYVNRRQFIVTGDLVPGTPEEVRAATEAWTRLAERLKKGKSNGVDPEGPILKGGRDNTLYRLACAWRRNSADEAEILARLKIINKKRCQPPLPAKDLRRIARSAYKHDPTPDFTDVGNGDLLVARHGDDLRYCYAWKRWLVWDGQRWRVDKEDRALELAKATARAIYQEANQYIQDGKKDLAKAAAKWAIRSQARPRVEAMLWAAQSLLPVSPAALDANPDLINLKNGTLELKTLKLREHRREDLITKLADIDYDPEAKCPLWDDHLARTFAHDNEVIACLQRSGGYAMTGTGREQKLITLKGPGGTGKSVTIGVIQETLGGDYARTLDFRALVLQRGFDRAIRNDLAALRGARLVIASEPPRRARLDEPLTKLISGGDKLSVRFLYGEFFDYRPGFVVFLVVNNLSIIEGQDDAFWRRMFVIPFEAPIPADQKDLDQRQKLSEERAGIFNWLAEGSRAYQERGLDPPKSVIEATETWRVKMDWLADFFGECCDDVRKENPGHFTPLDDLSNVYEAWCARAGKNPVTKSHLADKFEERGFLYKRKYVEVKSASKRRRAGEKRQQWGFLGLRIRGDGDDEI